MRAGGEGPFPRAIPCCVARAGSVVVKEATRGRGSPGTGGGGEGGREDGGDEVSQEGGL